MGKGFRLKLRKINKEFINLNVVFANRNGRQVFLNEK